MESKNKPKRSETIDDLLLELIIDILTRLPVKPLVKFRCVCKSWLLLISSSEFVKAHFNHASTKSKNYDNYSLVMSNTKNGIKGTYFTCPLSHVMSNTGSIDLNVLDFHVGDYSHIHISGICNGLLYIKVDARTSGLYNPATRKFKSLPPLSLDDGYNFCTTYGFCYDEVNDDYKIIELYMACTTSNMTKIHVYSLRNDSWTTIFYRNRVVYGRGGTSIGGVIYWTIINADRKSCSILSLDTAAYTYSTIAGPKLDGDYIHELSLGAFGGCLVAISQYFDEPLNVWAMQESWIKIVSMPPYISRLLRWPPFVLDNGEIFFHYMPDINNFNDTNLRLLVCNLREKSFVNDEIQDDRDLREKVFINYSSEIHGDIYHEDFHHVLRSVNYPVYCESLVEPSFDGE